MADIALDAPVFEPVPVAARNTFQTLGFGHGIRRVNRWADLSLLPTGVTESCHDIYPGPPKGTNAHLVTRAAEHGGPIFAQMGMLQAIFVKWLQ